MEMRFGLNLLGYTLLLISTVLIGGILIRKGSRGTRQGRTPHCLQCDYNVTGLENPRCPECGTPFTPHNVQFGQLHRSPFLVAAGLMAWGIAAWLTVPIYHDARHKLRSNWYFLRPTSMVIGDIQDLDLFEQASQELARRLRSNRLSANEKKRVATTVISCLVASRQGKTRGYVQSRIDLAADLLRAGELTPAQTNACFRSIEKSGFFLSPGLKPNRNYIRQNRSWILPPEQSDVGYLPRRVVTCVSIDDRSVDQVILDRFQVAGDTCGAFGDPLPTWPQKKAVLQVTTHWYDFGPEYSTIQRHQAGFLQNRTHQQTLHERADKPICTYNYELVLTPDNNWRGAAPVPTDPANPTTAP